MKETFYSICQRVKEIKMATRERERVDMVRYGRSTDEMSLRNKHIFPFSSSNVGLWWFFSWEVHITSISRNPFHRRDYTWSKKLKAKQNNTKRPISDMPLNLNLSEFYGGFMLPREEKCPLIWPDNCNGLDLIVWLLPSCT